MKLNIVVGEPLSTAQTRMLEHARKIDAGVDVEPVDDLQGALVVVARLPASELPERR